VFPGQSRPRERSSRLNPAAVTDLLRAWHSGSEEARDQVFEVTYGELRALAASYMRRERRVRPSFRTTVLVHEAFLRLVGTQAPWVDRAHFYGVAAQAMRRILVDHARRRRAGKRRPAFPLLSLEEAGEMADREGVAILKLDEALTDLARLDPRQARVVEMRYFGGLSVEETAETLELSVSTVKREWATARAWLTRQMGRSSPPR
jgi:RNA polymerase sigma-70 factor (ECF subfamily)